MAKTEGAKPFSPAEMDVLRLVIGVHGWSYGRAAKYINRPRSSVQAAYRRMKADGTINQLTLPGFEPRVEALDT